MSYIMPLGIWEKGEGVLSRDVRMGTAAGRPQRSRGVGDAHFWSEPLVFFLGRTLGRSSLLLLLQERQPFAMAQPCEQVEWP